MEILYWLVPAATLTVLSMVWIAWWGREGRGEIDRETAARRLGDALAREQRKRPGYAVPPREPERASGVALRPSLSRPVALPADPPADQTPASPTPPTRTDHTDTPDRRAS